jgi:hypothetical protein
VPAFGRDLIDKRLGDRFLEKHCSKQRDVPSKMVTSCWEEVSLASATVRRVSGASMAAGAFLIMAISLNGVRFRGRGNGLLVEAS